MITKESLNFSYQNITNWENYFRYSLLKYINASIVFLKDKAEITVKYKTEKEANAAGESFHAQFPVLMEVEDNKGNFFHLYVTKLYKKDDRFVVDGYHFSLDKWVEGCLTDDETETYEHLAGFLDAVINPRNDD